MMPNITSILPEFTNSEQDYIRRTFANSNYDALAKLPDNIRLHEVRELARAPALACLLLPSGPAAGGGAWYCGAPLTPGRWQVHKMRHAYMEAAKGMLVPGPDGGQSCLKATNKNGLFQEFDYMPSRYTLCAHPSPPRTALQPAAPYYARVCRHPGP